MARNRIIYQSEAVFVSKNQLSTSEEDHKQLKRIQKVDYSFSVPREYINQYGQLGSIDAIVTESPIVSLNFSYYLTNLDNEANLGFYVRKTNAIYTGSNGAQTTKQNGSLSGFYTSPDANFISNNLVKESGFNFFILTSSEGVDLNLENSMSGKAVVGIGNALVNNYTVEARVGQFPTVTVETQGLNMNSSFYKEYPVSSSSEEIGVPIPSVDPQNGKTLSIDNGYYVLTKLPNATPQTGEKEINALRPSDITLKFNDFLNSTVTDLTLDESEINLQSFSLSINLNRQNTQELGYKFVNSRPVGYPIEATLNINAIVNQKQTYNLINSIDNAQGKSILISIKDSKDASKKALSFDLRNFLLTSESFVSNVGSNKSVDLTFQAQFGSNNDLLNGVFASGSFEDSDALNLNKTYFNYNTNSNWFSTAAWYTDSTFTISKNSLPQSFSDVVMYGSSGAIVDLDNAAWITPKSIDTRNVSDPLGICFTSINNAIFSGTIYGASSYFGNARAS